MEISPKSEDTLFEGKVIEVLKQTVQVGGQEYEREFARRSPGSRFIIVHRNKILITEEYRPDLRLWDLRLPGGKVFDNLDAYHDFLKSGEDISIIALEAAKREASEEAGVDVKDAQLFAVTKAGASVEWDLYYFTTENFEEIEQHPEPTEKIEVRWFSFDEAIDLCLSGEISEDRTVGVLLRYLLQKKKAMNS